MAWNDQKRDFPAGPEVPDDRASAEQRDSPSSLLAGLSVEVLLYGVMARRPWQCG
jgi:hypothetical protein